MASGTELAHPGRLGGAVACAWLARIDLPPRVTTVRPLTAAALLITTGLLAALPFRRPMLEASGEQAPGIATGPRGATLDVASVNQVGQWPEGLSSFDASLAWQPVPIRSPQRSVPELPPMPDSYYDAAFELERPDPIRRRFNAAVDYRETPGMGEEPSLGTGSFLDAARDADLQSSRQPRAQHQQWAVEDLIEDRFVYTPIQPLPRGTAVAKDTAQRGTQAQQASAGRPGGAALASEGPSDQALGAAAENDALGARQFIREPQ
jgi:hypothetical protein